MLTGNLFNMVRLFGAYGIYMRLSLIMYIWGDLAFRILVLPVTELMDFDLWNT
jgi:hypothetical protein